MHLNRGVLTAMLLGTLTTPVLAQESSPASASTSVDVSRLGIDVSRIHRQLKQAEAHPVAQGLNLKYYIDVYGTSPRLQLFTSRKEAMEGPVPFGEPTHEEMRNIMTPREYRAPVMDFSALMRWLADHGGSK
jgi:hypothetical protein